VYSIDEVWDAVIAALKGSDLDDLCAVIDSYGGVVDDIVEEASKGSLITAQLPAIYVLYGGSRFPEKLTASSYDDQQTYSAITIAKDLRGRKEMRAGMSPLLELEKEVLIHNDLGLEIEPLIPVSILPIWISKTVFIFGFDLMTFFSIEK
jgi:phage gp37-like protein